MVALLTDDSPCSRCLRLAAVRTVVGMFPDFDFTFAASGAHHVRAGGHSPSACRRLRSAVHVAVDRADACGCQPRRPNRRHDDRVRAGRPQGFTTTRRNLRPATGSARMEPPVAGDSARPERHDHGAGDRHPRRVRARLRQRIPDGAPAEGSPSRRVHLSSHRSGRGRLQRSLRRPGVLSGPGGMRLQRPRLQHSPGGRRGLQQQGRRLRQCRRQRLAAWADLPAGARQSTRNHSSLVASTGGRHQLRRREGEPRGASRFGFQVLGGQVLRKRSGSNSIDDGTGPPAPKLLHLVRATNCTGVGTYDDVFEAQDAPRSADRRIAAGLS